MTRRSSWSEVEDTATVEVSVGGPQPGTAPSPSHTRVGQMFISRYHSDYLSPGSAQLPNADYYKHEHHHFYHAGPPKVVQVAVPVTQKPYVVQVGRGLSPSTEWKIM